MTKKIIALTILIATVFSFTTFAAKNNRGINTRNGGGGDYVVAYKAVQMSIPALMYHDVTHNPAEASDWTVTKEMLAADFLEIKERGYTPITVAEYAEMKKLSNSLVSSGNYNKVADFFRKNPKPIIITFDDGYKGIYNYVFPLLKEFGFKASFYVCGEYIDTQNPAYCTWGELKEMADSGLCDIGNHTYSLHKYIKEDLGHVYLADFATAKADINKNRSAILENTGVYTKAYSFPYGLYDEIILSKLKSDYDIFISTDYRINYIRDKQPALGRFNRSAFIPTEEYFDMVDSKCK
ncbi:MAG: polysaccharide deacetylase family protein [Clostridia bacterium]|nr:polysaccharide deacetylase family protein [Clostridia bacterium]